MLESQRSLATVQISRSTPTEIVESKAPVRESMLEGFRRRNALLDAFFYDVGKVSDEEAQTIAPWLAREGTLLIVPPSGPGKLCLCRNLEEFDEAGGRAVRILTVAGVGSSALGAAAFARNVADAFNEPVAAVVSGYGLSDLVTEAAGGWYWFGTLNRMRHAFEILDEAAQAAGRMEMANRVNGESVSIREFSFDTQAVYALLTDERFRFSLLTGHSKGNLVISEVLYELQASERRKLPDPETWLVTVSAVIKMPSRFKRIIDVMGGIDWFGALNSNRSLAVEVVPPCAWHHTNTEVPFHLPVTKVFKDLIDYRGLTLK